MASLKNRTMGPWLIWDEFHEIRRISCMESGGFHAWNPADVMKSGRFHGKDLYLACICIGMSQMSQKYSIQW